MRARLGVRVPAPRAPPDGAGAAGAARGEARARPHSALRAPSPPGASPNSSGGGGRSAAPLPSPPEVNRAAARLRREREVSGESPVFSSLLLFQSVEGAEESPGIPGAGPRFPPGSGPAAAGAGLVHPEEIPPARRETRLGTLRRFFFSFLLFLILILFGNNKRKPCSHESAASFSVCGLKDSLKTPFFLPPSRLPRIYFQAPPHPWGTR